MPAHGPWVQPADRPIPAAVDLSNLDVDTQATPGEYVEVAGTGAPTFTTVGSEGSGAGLIQLFIGVKSYDPLIYGHQARISLWGLDLGFFDTDPVTRAIWMPSVGPTFDELAAPHVIGFEWEDPIPTGSSTPGGHYVAADGVDVTLTSGEIDINGVWVDDVEHKTADVTADIWSAKQQWRRFPSADANWEDGEITSLVADPAWPTDLSGALVVEHVFEDNPAHLTVSDFAAEQNEVVLTGGTSHEDTVHFDDADLDTGRQVILVFAFDRATGNATYWAVPYIDVAATEADPERFTTYGSGWTKQAQVFAEATAMWTYRPPRYRLLYDIRPPQRQYPRDDGLGISTRRSWPPPTTKQYGQRRGPVGTVL